MKYPYNSPKRYDYSDFSNRAVAVVLTIILVAGLAITFAPLNW